MITVIEYLQEGAKYVHLYDYSENYHPIRFYGHNVMLNLRLNQFTVEDKIKEIVLIDLCSKQGNKIKKQLHKDGKGFYYLNYNYKYYINDFKSKSWEFKLKVEKGD